MRAPLREWVAGRDFERDALPEDDVAFLRLLGGPTLIRLDGRDSSRTRVVTTLLHANEPSGLRAVLRFLRSHAVPSTNVIFFVGAVGTALTEPFMSHRSLPDRTDANRVWLPPWATPEGEVARDVLDRIRAAKPEFLVDLHNNTGHNPAYGVAFGIGAAELSLVSLFADRVVHTPIQLRSLVEATHADFPSVTIECGRAGDPVADEVAWEGLVRFLDTPTVDIETPHRPVYMLGAPVRVCVEPGFDLSFSDRLDPKAALTVSKNVDRHNFERLGAGSAIGWLESASEWPLRAFAADGEECSRALFEASEGILRTRREFMPIMMTTNREIAASDCLFYAVQPLDPPEATLSGDFFSMTEPGRIGLIPGESPWWR
jgi:hypothetical protein